MFWPTLMQAAPGLGFSGGEDADIALPTAATSPFLLLVGLAGPLAHIRIAKVPSLAPATG